MDQNDHMQRSERLRVIIRAVSSGPRSIAELAELTGVSTISVRRDLADLAEQGAIERTRGGAAPAPARGTSYPFALRRTEESSTKRALAELASSLVRPGDSVFVDNGTTALAVAHELAGLGITAFASSLHAAAALAARPGNQVIVPGGPVDTDDLSFTGPGAAEVVRDMRFDIAIFGACAAHPDSGLTVAGWSDAQVKRAALAATSRVILVATSDKFSRTAAHRFGSYADLDTIVTTPDVDVAVRYEAQQAGAEVLFAATDA